MSGIGLRGCPHARTYTHFSKNIQKIKNISKIKLFFVSHISDVKHINSLFTCPFSGHSQKVQNNFRSKSSVIAISRGNMLGEEISLETDLKSAIKEALDRKGVMKDMRARLRASVFHCLEDKSVPLPTKKSKDLYISTELVREFLISLNLENTLSVFCEELGQESEMNCDKEFIAGELGFNARARNGEENIDSIPLLTLLVQQARLNKDNYEPDSSMITQKGA